MIRHTWGATTVFPERDAEEEQAEKQEDLKRAIEKNNLKAPTRLSDRGG